jgi:glycosyltransferase involved in cell wall biosynthesis
VVTISDYTKGHEVAMKVCYYLCDQANTRKSRGIWVYTNELITSLAKHNHIEIITLTSLDGPRIPGLENVILPVRTGSIPMRLAIDHIHPLMMPKADLYHYPKGLMPFISLTKAPQIASVLDTIVVHYYDNYRGKNNIFKPFELEYWLAILTRTLKQADVVITISHKSAEFIQHYCDRRGIKAPLVYVTHLASKYQGVPMGIFPEPKQNYALHFASELPHKRTGWLLKNWGRMEGMENGKELPELWLVGSLNQEQKQLAECIKRLKVFPYLTDERLKEVIKGARALIYPSEIEGFGLPALEAYQLGTPVIYVAGTSVEEILEIQGTSAPGRFELHIDDLSRALDEVLRIPYESLKRIQLELLSNFSWSKTAEQTLSAYKNIIA